MMQWILTSCLLIAAVLVLRAAAKNRLSARARYALWLLVLVRLLVPFSIGESPLSLMNFVPAEKENIAQMQTDPVLITDLPHTIGTYEPSDTTGLTAAISPVETFAPAETVEEESPVATALGILWFAGCAMTAAILLSCNLRLNGALKRSRKEVAVADCKLPVYETAVVETPCMFGLLRPAIYLIPELTEDEEAMGHVLAHEQTHFRHLDHIWALLRCVCLAVHWYNPLVWAAAYLSREDGELACDEGTLRRLGEDKRTAYGETLIALTCTGHSGLMTTATTMTGSKGGLKERIKRIADRRKASVIALVVVLVLAAVAAVALFTDEQPDAQLNGFWRTETVEGYEENGTNYPEAAVFEYEFRDGEGWRMCLEDGEFYNNRCFTYTADGDTLTLNYNDDYGVGQETVVVDGDRLTVYRGEELLYTCTPYQWELPPFLPEALLSLTHLHRYEADAVYRTDADYCYVMGYFAYLFRTAEVTVLEGAQVPDGATVYEFCGAPVELQIADGVLYDGTNGYELSNMDEIMDWIGVANWYPLDTTVDKAGQEYYELEDSSAWYNSIYAENLYLRLPMPSGYYETRHYVPENQVQWRDAVDEALANAVTDKPEGWSWGSGSSVLYVIDETTDLWLDVYPDGSVWWFEYGEGYMEYIDYYVTPEAAPQFTELTAYYRALYESEYARGQVSGDYSGFWMTTADLPEYGQTDLLLSLAYPQMVMAYFRDTAVTETLQVGILDGNLLLRLEDGTEYSLPWTVRGDTMILETAHGPLTLTRSTTVVMESLVMMSDVILLPARSTGVPFYPQVISGEERHTLETLITQGLDGAEETEDTIYTNEEYYRVLCLNELLDTNIVTISDRGTIHYNGDAWILTNAGEVLAFLERLYERS